MNLRALLIVAFAALFGLGTPLCAFFCLQGSAATPVAAVSHPEESAPCHGSAPASPGEAPTRESDCDCGDARVILTKSESAQAQHVVEIAAVHPILGSPLHPQPERSMAGEWKGPQHLPPLDLLLLKSTLLL